MQDSKLLKEAYIHKKKSLFWAYVLLILLGTLGLHRVYLRKYFSAFILFALTMFSVWAEINLGRHRGDGIFMLAIFWVFIDLFISPSMTRSVNVDIALELGLQEID